MTETKIICHGDSLTEGYGIPHRLRWSDLLAQNSAADFINTGISGDTTAGMLARFYPMVIAQNPTHVIITGGTNDVSVHLPQRDIIANLLTMVRQARHFDIIPILGIPPPFIFAFDAVEKSEIFLEPQLFFKELKVLQKNVALIAEEKDVDVIDFSNGMVAELFLEDGLHPNEIGQQMMAMNALVTLKEVIPNVF